MENYNLAIKAIAAFIRTLPADQQAEIWDAVESRNTEMLIADLVAELIHDEAD